MNKAGNVYLESWYPVYNIFKDYFLQIMAV